VPLDGVVPHRNLAAVVACDWFDTLTRARSGKRLAARVLHHWSPLTPLPEGSFGPFPEVTWALPPPSMPSRSGADNVVSRFAEDGTIEFGEYTSDNPW
jgi:hypothetical protein